MKAKFEVILMLALLASLLFSLPQQTVADEDVRYVYPTIETNCEEINATAYRFNLGNSLNLTFTFTTTGPVIAGFQENWTTRVKLEYPPGYYTETSFAEFWECELVDDTPASHTYRAAGNGSSQSRWRLIVPEAGEHAIKKVYLFKGYGDFEGFLQMSFLSEPKLMLENTTLPMPPLQPTPLLIGGVSGAGAAFAISAVIWHKKNSAKKEENNVNP